MCALLRLIIHHNVGVVLENSFVILQRIAQRSCVLIEYGIKRNDIENPAHIMHPGVLQGKAQRCKRFSAAGGNGEPVNAWRIVCRCEAPQ